MDILWNLLLYGSAVVVGLLPTALVLVALFPKKTWARWRSASWKGSLLLALLNMGLRVGCLYWALVVKMCFGYTEYDTFASIYAKLNFVDIWLLNFSTSVAQDIFGGGHVTTPSDNVGLALDFVIVFALFQFAWLIKKAFDNRKFETDVPKN